MDARLIPIVVGVGDALNRSRKPEEAVEPLKLMIQAIETAFQDTKLSPFAATQLRESVESIDVVRSWTWPYPDLPDLLCHHLGIAPKHKHYHPFNSGSTPGLFFDEASRRISLGDAKVAILTGGEALASLRACLAAKIMPPPGWTTIEKTIRAVEDPTTRELQNNVAGRHQIGAPIQGYPLFENGFRAHRGQTILDNFQESANLYGEFAAVARKNPNAWFYGNSETAESIKTVTSKNRMICFPYPLLMNAMNAVNIGAAILLTSTDYARELGIPEEKWIYALGGAGTRDSLNFWERPNFYSSPSISVSLDAAIAASTVNKEDVDLYDFYSCFPIVPKIASSHLDIPIPDPKHPVTLLGGLTFFGGAGNNYSMHALTEMVRALRAGRGKVGLVLANGGIMTYQHVVLLSTQPRRDGSPYPKRPPLAEVVADAQPPAVEERANGAATYTVDFGRDSLPLRGHIIGRLTDNNRRFIANHADESTLKQLCSMTTEPIGRKGWVRNDPASGRNLFSFENGPRL
ncbi:thiolase [Fonsecaea pedrosoi]|nr:thiolase [Fonsecaea pedrosoi]